MLYLRSQLLLLSCVMALALGSAPAARAGLIRVVFTGTVVPGLGGGGLVTPGQPATGSALFDPSVPDTDARPDIGVYRQTSDQAYFTLNIGPTSVSTIPTQVDFSIQIINDRSVAGRTVDRFGIITTLPGPLVPTGQVPLSFHLFLVDASRQVFSSDDMPSVLPALEDFEFALPSDAMAQVQGVPGDPVLLLNVRIETFEVVPEPCAALHVASTMLLGWYYRRSGRRRVPDHRLSSLVCALPRARGGLAGTGAVWGCEAVRGAVRCLTPLPTGSSAQAPVTS